MNIILTSVERGLADAWERWCGDLPFVTVHRGSIFDVPCDAVVSPANSFGFMDGGIDMLYTQHFGWGVQERLQEAIRVDHAGELLVGAAEIVETEDPDLPFLIAVPTMRVPTILRDTVNPYLAARAALLLAARGTFTRGTYAGKRSRTTSAASPSPAWGRASGGSARRRARARCGRPLMRSCWGLKSSRCHG